MSDTPDWSQFATKDDLEKGLSRLESRLDQGMSRLRTDMSQLETRLVRWMVGIYLTFLALLAGLVTISLNVTAIVNGLQRF